MVFVLKHAHSSLYLSIRHVLISPKHHSISILFPQWADIILIAVLVDFGRASWFDTFLNRRWLLLKLFVNVNCQILSESLWLVVFVLVVLHLILFSARFRLVPAANEELIKDLQKLLYLIHTLEQSFLLLDLWQTLFLVFLSVFLQQSPSQTLCHVTRGWFSQVIRLLGHHGLFSGDHTSWGGHLHIEFRELLFCLLEYVMCLDCIQDLFTTVSTGSLFDHLCKVCQLLDRVSDLLGESQYQHPNDQEKKDTACNDYDH